MGRILALPLMAALLASTAPAATPLLISPTIVQLPAAARRSAAIEVTNQSDEPVDVQLRGYDWSQAEGKDVLKPSTALAISPAIATIPPRAKQLFRLLDRAPMTVTERAFRIRVNELPKPGGTGAISVQLEFLVPAFRAAEQATPDLRWTRAADVLVAENIGNRHVRLVSVDAIAPGGARESVSGKQPVYLLAGSRRRFTLADPAAERVTGATGAGDFDVPLRAAPR